MAKWFGKVGYIQTIESVEYGGSGKLRIRDEGDESGSFILPDGNTLMLRSKDIETGTGVWVETPIEREYFGDLIRNHKRYESSEHLNDNITLQNEISIVCDPYAIENFQYIRYVEIMGTMWKVTAVDVQYPRLVLSIGGVYNGEQAGTADGA